jgi:hypothetical protein
MLCIRQCRPARKSRTGVGRQHFGSQQLPQAGAPPQVGSQAGPAAHVGAAAQPQAGSAAAHVASQQLGWQQPPPSMRSSKPALTSAVSANIAQRANKGKITRDFMGRTPVPVGNTDYGLKLNLGRSCFVFRLQLSEVSSGFAPAFACLHEVRVLPNVPSLSVDGDMTVCPDCDAKL